RAGGVRVWVGWGVGAWSLTPRLEKKPTPLTVTVPWIVSRLRAVGLTRTATMPPGTSLTVVGRAGVAFKLTVSRPVPVLIRMALNEASAKGTAFTVVVEPA